MEIRIPKHGWAQIGGDMNPGTYGGTIAQADGRSIELLKIQPVREYIGDAEAVEMGHPFWTREAYFDIDDLDLADKSIQRALSYVGLDEESLLQHTPEARAMAIAEALLEYGHAEEGPAGWAEDILPTQRVRWWGSKSPAGWRFLADEDVEFRELLKEHR